MPLKRTTTHTVRFSMRTKEPVSIGGTTVSISKQHELQGAEEVVIVFADTKGETGTLYVSRSETRYEPNTRDGVRPRYQASNRSFVNTLEELGDVQHEARRRRG